MTHDDKRDGPIDLFVATVPGRSSPKTGHADSHELSGSVPSVKIHGKIREDVAVGFIINNLSSCSLVAFLDEERLRAFRDLVADGKTIAAAAEYQSVTGAGIQECHLAVEVTVACNRAPTPA